MGKTTLRSTPTSLATCFNAFRPSGNSTMSVSLTGATGTGAKTYPLLSVIAMTFSPFWCLYPEYPMPSPLFWPRCWSRRHAARWYRGASRRRDAAHWRGRPARATHHRPIWRWVGTRRVAIWYVSSSPPFRTVLEAFTSHGSALSDQSWSSLCGKRCRVPVNFPGGLHPEGF